MDRLNKNLLGIIASAIIASSGSAMAKHSDRIVDLFHLPVEMQELYKNADSCSDITQEQLEAANIDNIIFSIYINEQWRDTHKKYPYVVNFSLRTKSDEKRTISHTYYNNERDAELQEFADERTYKMHKRRIGWTKERYMKRVQEGTLGRRIREDREISLWIFKTEFGKKYANDIFVLHIPQDLVNQYSREAVFAEGTYKVKLENFKFVDFGDNKLKGITRCIATDEEGKKRASDEIYKLGLNKFFKKHDPDYMAPFTLMDYMPIKDKGFVLYHEMAIVPKK